MWGDWLEKYMPPLFGFIVFIPVFAIWWVLWILGIVCIQLFVPFKYTELVEAKYNARFHPEDDQRRLNREWLTNISE